MCAWGRMRAQKDLECLGGSLPRTLRCHGLECGHKPRLGGETPAAQEVTGGNEPGGPHPKPGYQGPFAFHTIMGYDPHQQGRNLAFIKGGPPTQKGRDLSLHWLMGTPWGWVLGTEGCVQWLKKRRGFLDQPSPTASMWQETWFFGFFPKWK